MQDNKPPKIADTFTLEQRELLWHFLDHMELIVSPLIIKFKSCKGWRKDKWLVKQIEHYEKLKSAYRYAKTRLFRSHTPDLPKGVNLDPTTISTLIPWSDKSYINATTETGNTEST